MIKFPTMIEFIDEIGLNELHATHKECKKISFNDFVEAHYESLKESWEEDLMEFPKKSLDVPFNAYTDMTLETAKGIMVAIVNDALKSKNLGLRICEEELVPDYFLVGPVLTEFFSKVLPAVEKSLNDLEE